ncbi:MAG: site-specific integrase [Treponema sp.]|jgi:integrase|nr:site-specific integrase [Treponema sp.]
MGVNIRVNRGKLYLDIFHNGRRKWESLGLTLPSDKTQRADIMRLAEVCKSKREAQILSGEWGMVDPVGGKQTLIEYMNGIATNRGQNDFTHKAVKHLELFPGGNISLGGVTEKWLEDFQEYLLKETDLSKKTIAHYSGAVRYALRKAARDRIIPRNPAVGVKGVSVPESDKIYLTAPEVQALANVPINGELGAEIKQAFLFGCYTGLRISDLKTLAWGDIQRDPPQINKQQEKTKRKAFVPLHAVAWGIIDDKRLHGYKDPVFPALSKSKTNTNEYLKRWAKKAGIEKNIGWHTARHTFAVLSLESGAEIYMLSKLLGHTDVKTTQVYANATDKMKREAVNALPAITIANNGGDK